MKHTVFHDRQKGRSKWRYLLGRNFSARVLISLPPRVAVSCSQQEDHHGDGIYCSNVQCPDRTTPSMYGAADCSGMCGESDCCEAKCSYHQCPQFSTPLDEADDIVCPELICTNDLCCEALCSYYQCPDGETLVEDADDIVCPDLQCSAELCCKIRKSPILTAVPFCCRERFGSNITRLPRRRPIPRDSRGTALVVCGFTLDELDITRHVSVQNNGLLIMMTRFMHMVNFERKLSGFG